ncbi:hypothetical protein C2G38_2274940 [Gigaspora rosea]|uniref:Uncharacterized protein n=1 Tax=Gigaspora rosea TaxID=44941 RepID=A0A397UC75_9GLOM|nr:hypothetical protein C2G38_2274940 [Gigaspora rosea]
MAPVLSQQKALNVKQPRRLLGPHTGFVAQQEALNDKNQEGPYHATSFFQHLLYENVVLKRSAKSLEHQATKKATCAPMAPVLSQQKALNVKQPRRLLGPHTGFVAQQEALNDKNQEGPYHATSFFQHLLYENVVLKRSAKSLEHQATKKATCAPMAPVLSQQKALNVKQPRRLLGPHTGFVAQQEALNDKNQEGPYHATSFFQHLLYENVVLKRSAKSLEHQATKKATCAPMAPVLSQQKALNVKQPRRLLGPHTGFVAQQEALNDKNQGGPYHATSFFQHLLYENVVLKRSAKSLEHQATKKATCAPMAPVLSQQKALNVKQPRRLLGPHTGFVAQQEALNDKNQEGPYHAT